MVATYLTPLDPQTEEPQRADVRYYSARMPETKMMRLVNGSRALRPSGGPGRRSARDLAHGGRACDVRRLSSAFWTSITPPSICRRRRSISSARPPRRRIAGFAPGGTNCTMSPNRERPEASAELGYLRNNRDKMDYARYRALGLIISSGPVKPQPRPSSATGSNAAVMRRTREGGQHILNLRVQVQSKRWDALRSWHLEQTTRITNLQTAA